MPINTSGESLCLDETGQPTELLAVTGQLHLAIGYIAVDPVDLIPAINVDAAEGLSPTADTYTKYHDPNTYEVIVSSSVTLIDYERITPAADMERLREYAEKMQGKEIMFINATSAGGGVAIMRAPLVHLLNLLGVNAKWYALMPDQDKKFFDVTKQKFHNVLQGVASLDVRLTEEDKVLYDQTIGENAEVLEGPLRTANVIICDDWQPSGLIPYIKGSEHQAGFNPSATILFRDHIHTEGKLMGTPGTPQYDTWSFIWKHNRVKDADAFITHPKDEFVPPDVPDKNVVYMPATGDLLDDLNGPLTDQERAEGLAFINNQLVSNENQTPLDRARPYIVLIARFDPSKGMPEGMESYAKARTTMVSMGVNSEDIPQLVVLGNGSVDDPDGKPELAKMMRLRAERYEDIKDDIKVARVPHNDKAINALLKGASLALQPSIKEGFESRVTDAILQGVPVIGSDRGGIPLQIISGESGYVVDPYDTDRWAGHITGLMTDSAKYEAMRRRTRELAETFNYRYTTVPNALRWLRLSHLLLTDKASFEGNKRWVEDIGA